MSDNVLADVRASPSPICSVCIANYNGVELIDACIESVLAQDCDFAFEIIIHDDASTDQSVSHIKQKYPDVILITSAYNVGFCIANNRMADVANGEFLLFLNNDASLFPDALQSLHQAAVSVALPAILGLPQYDAADGKLIDIGSTFDLFLNPIPNLDPTREDVGMIIGACLWLPASLWLTLGGFPAWFGSIAEDTYLCCLARSWGYPVRALSTSGFRHWVGKSYGGGKISSKGELRTSRSRRALSERNKTYVMCLCYPLLWACTILPIHLALLMVEGALVATLKRDYGLWKTIYAPVLPTLWHKRKMLLSARRVIQSRRRIGLTSWSRNFQAWPHKLTMLLKHGLPDVR